MSEVKELPNGWKYMKLGDLAKRNTGKVLPSDHPNLKFIGMDCIEPHTLQPTFLYDFKEFKSSGNSFKKNQVLYGRMRPYLNKVFKADFDGACSGEFIVLDCNNLLLPDLLKYILHSRGFVSFANSITTGDRPRISYDEIAEYQIAVAPLPTQAAIVSKIEELFSELDKGIESLRTAQQQLRTYRQSVLKWAFEGLKEATFEKVIAGSQNGISKRSGKDGVEYKVLRLADITKGVIDSSSPRTIKLDKSEVDKYKLKLDDLVCIRVNGSKDLVGKLVHVSKENEKENWAYCDHFIRFSLNEDIAVSKFYYYYFITLKVRKYIQDNMVTSAGQNTVSQGTIKNVPVPICSPKEQQQIVEEIERRLTVADKMEESISQSLLQSEALRQSILKMAFEGRLVK